MTPPTSASGAPAVECLLPHHLLLIIFRHQTMVTICVRLGIGWWLWTAPHWISQVGVAVSQLRRVIKQYNHRACLWGYCSDYNNKTQMVWYSFVPVNILYMWGLCLCLILYIYNVSSLPVLAVCHCQSVSVCVSTLNLLMYTFNTFVSLTRCSQLVLMQWHRWIAVCVVMTQQAASQIRGHFILGKDVYFTSNPFQFQLGRSQYLKYGGITAQMGNW